jgi:zinc protease
MIGPALTAPAQTSKPKQQPPPVAPERPFNFPPHSTTRLDNGLTVFVVEDHRQPMVSATLMMPGAGASAHAGAKAGLAAMTASLLRQGTATRSAQQIAESIDRVGGSLTASAGADSTEASVSVLTPDLDTGFALLADIVQKPAFAEDEIERWRRQTLSSLQVAYRDPEYLRDVVGERVAYGDHPYAFPTDGFPDTVRSLSRDDVVAFYRERYTPSGSFMAVAGDITPDAAVDLVRKHFSGWKGAAVQEPKAPAPPNQRRIIVVDQPEAVQTQFGMVGPGVRRNDADYLPLSVANQVLGGGSSSRLFLRLRSKEGLTYGAGSSLDAARLAGVWNITSFTRTEETGKALNVMLEVVNEFGKNPVTPAELNEATSYLSGVFAIQSETANAVAGRVLTSALHGLPDDYWQTYRDRVKKVTAADVSGAVGRHLVPGQLSIVAVGNAAGFAKSLEPLGSVTVVPLSKLDLTKPGLVAQAESAAGPDAAARGLELIKAAAKAAGGAELLNGIKDVTVTGDITVSIGGNDVKGESRGLIVYPDKVKAVIKLPMGEIVQVYDGSQAWMSMAGQPATTLPPEVNNEMRRVILMSGTIGLIREAIEGRAQVAALEPKAVEGVNLDRASWKNDDIDMVLGFDPATHHIVNVTYRGITPMGPAEVETRLSGHKKNANGMVAATHSVSYQNGQKVADLTITSSQFNTGVSPEEFVKK